MLAGDEYCSHEIQFNLSIYVCLWKAPPQRRFGIYTMVAMGQVGRSERFGHEDELTYSCMDYERGLCGVINMRG